MTIISDYELLSKNSNNSNDETNYSSSSHDDINTESVDDTESFKQNKWTAEDISNHQKKMYNGEIPWEEIWEVPGYYEAEEYYNMMDEDSHWELIDKRIIVHSPAGMEHQDIVGCLYELIRSHVVLTGWGLAYTAPAGLEIKGLSNKYEPDIFAISSKKAQYVKGSYCKYVPELIIEVALTSEALKQANSNKQKKLRDYAKIGVMEYLVIYAPQKTDVEYFRYYNQKGRFIKKKKGKKIILESIGLTFPTYVIENRQYWRKSVIVELLDTTLVKHIKPKVRVNGVDPKIRVNGVDPKIRVEGVDPKIRVEGVDPKVRVEGVDPKVRVEGVDPKVRVDGVDPKVRVEGLTIQDRIIGLSEDEKDALKKLLS